MEQIKALIDSRDTFGPVPLFKYASVSKVPNKATEPQLIYHIRLALWLSLKNSLLRKNIALTIVLMSLTSMKFR